VLGEDEVRKLLLGIGRLPELTVALRPRLLRCVEVTDARKAGRGRASGSSNIAERLALQWLVEQRRVEESEDWRSGGWYTPWLFPGWQKALAA
jgi:hypothetical protein